ncbi:MAG: hypothetical protein WCQ47_07185 [bacterium]
MSLTKERLLVIINRALNFEEEAVQTVSRNISSAVEFLEKDASVKKRVKDIMDQLGEESNGHARILFQLKDIVAEEEKDVY